MLHWKNRSLALLLVLLISVYLVCCGRSHEDNLGKAKKDPSVHQTGQIDLTKLDQRAIRYVTPPTNTKLADEVMPVTWDFRKDSEAWTTFRDLEKVKSGNDRPRYLAKSNGEHLLPILASPERLGVDASTIDGVAVKMSVTKGKRFCLFWKMDGMKAEETSQFERFLHRGQMRFLPMQSYIGYISAEGEPVEYLISIQRAGSWKGTIDSLYLMPTDHENSEISVEHIKLIPKNYELLTRRIGISEMLLNNKYLRSFFVRSASSITVPLHLDKSSSLDVYVGKTNSFESTTFIIRAKNPSEDLLLLEEVVEENDTWKRLSLALPFPFQGELILATRSEEPNALSFWGNPVVYDDSDYKKNLNVIFYLIDALRADHVRSYGYERNTTPNIDRFAKESICFDRCIAQASWTRPSMASIMTSTYGNTHGVNDHRVMVPEGLKKLAEVLSENGYYTAAFLSNYNAGHDSGLDRGYDYLMEKTGITGPYTSMKLNEVLFPWLSENYRKRFYVYVHSMDSHIPYAPDEQFAGVFSDNIANSSISSGKISQKILEIAKSEEDIEYVISKYDEAILSNDYQFGRLIEHIKELGIYDNTIIIVTADHGEQFQEHGSWEHGQSCYQEEIHVPLIMRIPGCADQIRYPHPVELIDLYPTLLTLLDLPFPETIHGKTLVSIIDGSTSPNRCYAFSEQPGFGKKQRYMAITDGHKKLIQDIDREELLLFDLIEDPREQKNIAAENAKIVEKYKRLLDTWKTETRKRPFVRNGNRKSYVDREVLENLKALGYIQ